MNIYIYAADLWCEACAHDIMDRLRKNGIDIDISDETSYDSGEFPKGPYFSFSNEADSPCHCGSGNDCLDPLVIDNVKYGAFLENNLTEEGVEYVKDAHRSNPTAITEFWMNHYDLWDRCE